MSKLMSQTLARAEADLASGQPMSTDEVKVRRRREDRMHLITLHHTAETARLINAIEGARWNPHHRRWEVPFIARVQLRKVIERVTEMLRASEEQARREYDAKNRRMLDDMAERRARNEAFYGRPPPPPSAS
ncbi:hypothetical protein EOD42_22510 [Rhodovarius crocodyli]|uniref:Uncharacterized protein n=1 Tax=Rhodovarius crocodyli TaxID=1979269 RepID=A0A437M169_9PROT|nr:hypothetical protein [Rhodovarius crocodyli]RVT91431.1 hypothetical protein EOD42_22510 [Rhodovarius crocodyli]